jgi:hypothetical protein
LFGTILKEGEPILVNERIFSLPTIDFTLDDLKGVMKETIRAETPQIVSEVVRPIINDAINDALIKERAYNRAMMYEVSREVSLEVSREVATEVISTELMNFWDHNLGPVLEEILDELNRHGRILVRHSKDIIELRAAQ